MHQEALKLININRDAVSVNRGFYYQYLQVLHKWVEKYLADSDDDVLIEVGDDIQEKGDQLVFTQVKCYTSNFSLRSVEVRKALFNFFTLYLRERETNPDLKFIFETNTSIARNDTLLKNWVNAGNNLGDLLLIDCIQKLKDILSTELKKVRDQHLNNSSLTNERKLQIKSAFLSLDEELTSQHLSTFIKCIQWNFVGQPPDTAVELLTSKIQVLLNHRKFGDKPVSGLTEVLLSEIFRCSQIADASLRKVNRKLLDRLISLKTEELASYTDSRLINLLDQRFSNIHKSLQELQDEITGIKSQLDQSSTEVPHFITTIPFVKTGNIFQFDQDAEILHQQIPAHKHIAITGAGGMGKSTLAKYYAQRFESDYGHVVWLNGEAGLIKSILFKEDLLANLNISLNKSENEEKIYREFLRKLNQFKGSNLLVIDEFSDEALLGDLLSLANWKILLTTRSRFQDIEEFRVNQLTAANAKALYRKHEPNKIADEATIDVFLQMVDFNPLVIEIAAKTIHNSADLDLAKFSGLLKSQSLDDEELEIDISVQPNGNSQLLKILKQAFDISGLEKNDGFQLQFFALLPTEFKISDLVTWYGAPWAKGNKVAFANVINRLHQHGWLEREGDDVTIHNMLQESIIYRLRAEKIFLGFVQQVGWLSHRLREGTSGNFNQALQFLRYGETILKKIKESDREGIQQPLMVLENEVLNVYNWIRSDDKTERLKSLLARAAEYLGSDDAFVGIVHNNLGMSLVDSGDFEAAETELKKAKEILLQKPHKSETQLLYAVCNLAMLYIHTGDFNGFQQQFDETIALRKKLKVKDDPSFPIQCNMLGFAQQSAGNFKQAIILYSIAVSAHRQLSNEKRNDLNLILYFNNLAYCYFRDGQQDRAVAAIHKAVDQLELLSVSNDNKVFVILLYTLIEIAEKTGSAEDLNSLLETLNTIKNAPPQNKT